MRRALCIVAVLAGAAHADPDYQSMHATGSVTMSVGYQKVLAPAKASELSHLAALGLGGSAVVGRGLGWAPSFDLGLGGGVRGGFLYGFELRLLGVGTRLGRTGLLVLSAGGGLGGVTARVPFSWTLPVQARVELDLSKQLRLVAWSQSLWTLSHARRGGTRAPLGDELSAGLGIRVGRRVNFWAGSVGDGTYVGLTYAEQLGTRFVGAVLGYGLSAAH